MAAYSLSPRAQLDIEEIWDYTAERWSVTQAEVYIRQLQEAIEVITQEPKLGRACDEVRTGYYKYPTGSHIL